MRSSILKSLATVSGLTMMSRILGFGRQVLIAGVIGAGGNPVADAFWAAFRLPNLFRRLFAEGAFQSAFVPLFQGKLIKEDQAAAKKFAEEVLAGLLFVLLILTLIVELAAPVAVNLVASGFRDDPEKFELTTIYLRIMFPYLACMSVVGLLSGILNSLDRFMAYAGAPLLLNICQIAALAYFASDGVETTGLALSVATAVSGFLQLGLLVWAARRQGYFLNLSFPKWTPGVSRLMMLGMPGFISAAAVQINIVIGTNIASQQPGAVSWLMNADQLYQLPLAVIGIALGSVLLPLMSRRVKEGDEAGALSVVNRSLEMSSLLVLPAAAAFIIMPDAICDALFRGIATEALSLFGGRQSAFTPEDVRMTAGALALFGIGLPAFVWQKVFLPAFYSREDTRTPMKFALWAIVINTVVALALFPAFGFFAVAFATSLATWVQIALLAFELHKRRQFQPDTRLFARITRTIAATAVMAAAIIWARGHESLLTDVLFGKSWLAVIALVTGGGIVYGAALMALGGVRLSDYKAR
ncbi:MAG: murein biosynthesis integral membrane protein MurJ [Pseudomonadota bacterium]